MTFNFDVQYGGPRRILYIVKYKGFFKKSEAWRDRMRDKGYMILLDRRDEGVLTWVVYDKRETTQ